MHKTQWRGNEQVRGPRWHLGSLREQTRAERLAVREPLDLLVDLARKLTRRAYNNGAQAVLRRTPQQLKDGQHKRQRLA